MRNWGTCDIENTVTALEQEIENRKKQIYAVQIQSSSSNTNSVSHLFSEIFNRAGSSYGQIGLALEQGGEFARNFIRKSQKNLEDRPWDFLRKVAIYSFGIGLFLSLRHKKSPAEGQE